METIFIDFSNAKTMGQLHHIVKQALHFPDWYGENLDALWDLLTGYIAPCIVDLKGYYTLPKELRPYAKEMLKIFLEAEAKYHTIHVRNIE